MRVEIFEGLIPQVKSDLRQFIDMFGEKLEIHQILQSTTINIMKMPILVITIFYSIEGDE